ncbi:hypothetical protein, partial [Mesorhizobium sp. M7A.F.Ca.CA.004.11.2.1]|uniref:hypothetical protein n=1 Tax=Mesorhizobium sp. M7A.F.Ca.CA.004.11.2.1 TaxID=2496699 RepID=UPI0019D0D35E
VLKLFYDRKAGHGLAFSLTPGLPWFRNSMPASSRTVITARTLSKPLVSPSAPFFSIALIVLMLIPARLASVP